MIEEVRLIDLCCFENVPKELLNSRTFTTACVMREFVSFIRREVTPDSLLDRIVMSHAHENDNSGMHRAFYELDETAHNPMERYFVKLILLHSASYGIEVDFRHLRGEAKKRIQKKFFHLKQRYGAIFDSLGIPIHSHQSYIVFGNDENKRRVVRLPSHHLDDCLAGMMSFYDEEGMLKRMRTIEDRGQSIVTPDDIWEYIQFQRSIPLYLDFRNNSAQILDYELPEFFLPIRGILSKKIAYELFVEHPQEFSASNMEALLGYAGTKLDDAGTKLGYSPKHREALRQIRFKLERILRMQSESGHSREQILEKLKPKLDTDINLVFSAYQAPYPRVVVWTHDSDVKDAMAYLGEFRKALEDGRVDSLTRDRDAIGLQKYIGSLSTLKQPKSVCYFDPVSEEKNKAF